MSIIHWNYILCKTPYCAHYTRELENCLEKPLRDKSPFPIHSFLFLYILLTCLKKVSFLIVFLGLKQDIVLKCSREALSENNLRLRRAWAISQIGKGNMLFIKCARLIGPTCSRAPGWHDSTTYWIGGGRWTEPNFNVKVEKRVFVQNGTFITLLHYLSDISLVFFVTVCVLLPLLKVYAAVKVISYHGICRFISRFQYISQSTHLN